MARRRKPTGDEKVAALLLELWALKGDPVPTDVAREMTAAQICSLVEWHHATYHAWVPSNHPTIITPLLIGAHRERTAKVDIPAIAKVKRIARKRAAAAQAADPVLAAIDGVPPARPTRGMRGARFRGWRTFKGAPVWNPRYFADKARARRERVRET